MTVLLLLLIVQQLGFWLVNTKKPSKADAIFLLMGDIDDRVPLCIDLYKAGYASAIVMVEPSDEKSDSPLQEGIQLPGVTEIVCDILVQKKLKGRQLLFWQVLPPALWMKPGQWPVGVRPVLLLKKY